MKDRYRGTVVGWTLGNLGVTLRLSEDRAVGEPPVLYYMSALDQAIESAGNAGYSVDKIRKQTAAWVQTGSFPIEGEIPVTGDDLLTAQPEEAPIDLIEIDGQAVNPNDLFLPEPPKRLLTPHQLLQLGATMPDASGPSSRDIDRHLQDQREQYKLYSKEDLVEELVRRDKGQILQGQQAANGKMAQRLLREFVRGILYTVDRTDLNATANILSNGGKIEEILKLLGAEPAGLRDLRMNGGTTLGPISGSGNPEMDIESLPLYQRTMPRADVAQQIRDNPNKPETIPQDEEERS